MGLAVLPDDNDDELDSPAPSPATTIYIRSSSTSAGTGSGAMLSPSQCGVVRASGGSCEPASAWNWLRDSPPTEDFTRKGVFDDVIIGHNSKIDLLVSSYFNAEHTLQSRRREENSDRNNSKTARDRHDIWSFIDHGRLHDELTREKHPTTDFQRSRSRSVKGPLCGCLVSLFSSVIDAPRNCRRLIMQTSDVGECILSALAALLVIIISDTVLSIP